MNCIAAVDENWGIGREGKLLVSIPADMKFFRETTMGKTLIMGRKTLDSFPGGQPLKRRRNICLTRDPAFAREGVEVAHSVEEALALIAKEDPEDVFVIGGETVYRQFLPYCEKAYITAIEYTYAADAHFPNLEKVPDWRCVSESEEGTYFDITYTFRTYERRPS